MIALQQILPLNQYQLFHSICKAYKGNYIASKKNFIFVKGVAPILLVAHLDTVHAEPVKQICASADGNILMSPQGIGGDDCCGVYALNKIYEMSAVKPFLLFTCNEEVGGIGAKVFCNCLRDKFLSSLCNSFKLIIEIDRKGNNDAVYYDCVNPNFEHYISSKGFKTALGSFSDISLIAPTLGVAAVNLSAGYYNPHTLHEFINLQELNSTINRVVDIVADSVKDDFHKFQYLEHYAFDGYWNDYAFENEPVPCEYEQIYSELLELYTAEELEELRHVYGNQVLQEIYFNDFCKGEK